MLLRDNGNLSVSANQGGSGKSKNNDGVDVGEHFDGEDREFD